jgi:threonylcarbamoyladenosine tRNA methylthiotransferase MtaB
VPTVVVGCYATAEADPLRRLPGVVAVLGHDRDICNELRRVALRRQGRSATPLGDPPTRDRPAVAGDTRIGDRQRGDTKPLSTRGLETPRGSHLPTIVSISRSTARINGEIPADRTIRAFAGHQRAFLKVQDGCDAFCTYCIIPRLRPELCSKSIPAAVAETRALVRAGHREIVITGIYLGAYGRPTAVRRRFRGAESPLADLVEAVARVPGLQRLRLSSLEPGDVDARLLTALRHHACCVPHLHLPLQAGSPDVLRRMNRQYTAEQFLDMMARVKDALDRPAITTDVVVGFPGETEPDFQQTLDVARQAGFCKIHAFPFSPRPGTAAAQWVDRFVPPAVVKQRMARLADVERETAGRFRRSLIGCTERVIVEEYRPAGTDRIPVNPLLRGRTDRYFEVHFEGPGLAAGDLARVRIDRVTTGRVRATLIEKLG